MARRGKAGQGTARLLFIVILSDDTQGMARNHNKKMKLKDYIQAVLELIPEDIDCGITFDVGVDTDMEINQDSPNRVKFTCKRK